MSRKKKRIYLADRTKLCTAEPERVNHLLLNTDNLAERHPFTSSSLAWLEHCAAHNHTNKESKAQTISKGNSQTNLRDPSNQIRAATKTDLVYNKNDYLTPSHAREADPVKVKTQLISEKHTPTFKERVYEGNFHQDDSRIIVENGGYGRCDCCPHDLSHRITKKSEIPCRCQHRRLASECSARRSPLTSPENKIRVPREGNHEFLYSRKNDEAVKSLTVDIHNSVLRDPGQGPCEGNLLKGEVKDNPENRNDTLSCTRTGSSSFLRPEAGAAMISASRDLSNRCLESSPNFTSGASRSHINISNDSRLKRPKSSSPLANKSLSASTERSRRKSNLREEALRSRFISLCSCYWNQFPELGMPINPASHAPTCPCHDKQSEYEAAVMSSEETSEESFIAGAARSRSSSFNGKSELGRDHERNPHECYTQCRKHGAPISSADRGRPGREACTKTKELRVRKQTTAAAVRSTPRSAIFGAAKRRMIFDKISSAGSVSGSSSSSSSSPLPASRQRSRASGRSRQKEDGSSKRPRTVDKIVETPLLVAVPEDGSANSTTQSNSVDKESSETVVRNKEESTDTHQNSPTFSILSPESPCTKATDTSTDKKKEPNHESVERGRSLSRSRCTSRRQRATSPGPGAYDVLSAYARSSANLEPRQVSFGKAPRRTLEVVATNTETPGPGTYDILSSGGTPLVNEGSRSEERKASPVAMTVSSASFLSKSPRVLRYQPGTYPLEADHNDRNATPGPGQYSTETAGRLEARHTSAPAYSFGRSSYSIPPPLSEASALGCRTQGLTTTSNTTSVMPCDLKGSIAPGPADYDVRTGDEIGASGRCAVLGTSSARSTSPLPDNTAVIGVMANSNRMGEVPGPGSYALDVADRCVRPKPPSYSFSGLSRAASPLLRDAMKSPLSQQDSSLSPWVHTPLPLPGPNHHDTMGAHFMTSQHRSSPQCTIRSQRFHDARQRLPNSSRGPHGDSSLLHAINRANNFPYDACDSASPGPGEYMPLYTTQQRCFKGYSFGKAPRSHRPTTTVCNAPGDGDAVPRSEGGAADSVPGPGSYAVEGTAKPIAGFIAKAPRPHIFVQSEETSGNFPGPGTYELDSVVTMANRPSAVIGSTVRQGLLVSNTGSSGHLEGDLPGPGSYELPELSPVGPVCFFNRSARSFSAAKRDGSNADDFRVPGPDAYYLPPRSSQQNVFMGPSLSRAPRFSQDLLDEKSKGSIPGAGAYDVLYDQRSDLKGTAVAVSNRGAVFGTAPRGDRIGESGDGGGLPGPGSYDPQYTLLDTSPRSIIFAGAPSRGILDTGPVDRNENHENQSGERAGPGSYDPNLFSNIPTYPRTTFSQASRSLATQEHYPNSSSANNEVGPGTYSPMFVDVEAHQRGTVIGTAPRKISEQACRNEGAENETITPGPGAYEVYLTRDGHHISYHPTEADALQHIRGPVSFSTAPSSRNVLEGAPDANYTNSVPGPGAYDLADSAAFGSGSPGAFMGTQKRFTEDRGVHAGNRGMLTGGEPENVPGPGYYQPDYAHVETRLPAFGFGAARVHEGSPSGRSVFNAADNIPGPGEYDTGVSIQHSGQPAHSFFTASRFPEDSERGAKLNGNPDHHETVGPGSYDVGSSGAVRLTTRTAPAYTFPSASTARDMVRTTELTSGEREGIHKTPMVSTEVTPGPGDYQPIDGVYLTRPSFPVYTFGAADRFHSPPGSAEDPLIPAHEATRRGGSNTGQSLGPGSYSIPPAFPSGPQHRFGTAPTHRGIGLVSPTADEVFPKGTDEGGRAAEGSSGVPGPGSYDVIASARGPAITISSNDERRFWVDLREQKGIPGPGAYDVAAVMQANFAPMVPRAPRFNDEGGADKKGEKSELTGASTHPMPGPGTYSPKASSIGGIGTGPSPAFSKAERKITSEGHQPPVSVLTCEPSPGPGHYNVQDYLPPASVAKGGIALKYTAARFGIGEEAEGKNSTPGPGYYDASVVRKGGISAEEAGPSFSQSERFPHELQKESSSGEAQGSPGWYDIPLMLRAPACSFGKALRFQEGKNPQSSNGIGDHPEAVSAASLPGPGSYDVEEAAKATLRRAPAFSMIPRRSEDAVDGSHDDNLTEKKTSLPGPGHYDVLNYRTVGEPGSRAATFYGRYESIISDTPGPGSYDTKQHHIGNEAPAFSMTGRAAARELEPGSDAPGPGSYDAASALAHLRGPVPAFSIVGRGDLWNTRMGGGAETPGPGHYVLSPQPSGPAAGFGVSSRATTAGAAGVERGFSKDNSGVGPGTYDVHVPTSGPAYSFYHSHQPLFNAGKITEKGASRDVESLPGPGLYHSLHVESQPPNPGPSISFPRAPRMDSTQGREVAPTPGPGEYYRPQILIQGNSGAPTYSIIGKSHAYLKTTSTASGPTTHSSAMDRDIMGGGRNINKGVLFDADSRPQLTQATNIEVASKSLESTQSGSMVVDTTIPKPRQTKEELNTEVGGRSTNDARLVRRVHFADEESAKESERLIPSSNLQSSFADQDVQNNMDMRAIYLEKLAKVGYPVRQRPREKEPDNLYP
ncbi:unnamed protein product [Phytomonas sp. EM1]|nr:unnamed protein product [Phytomonas sp. EM1]|eukprot:CCW61328.1 unnamed protein product [Phytomonas sp. isolate EM1]